MSTVIRNVSKEFSFDEFKKSELFKKCSESFYKQPENPGPDSSILEYRELSDEEVMFAINSITEIFK